jgi:hypothetical protein
MYPFSQRPARSRIPAGGPAARPRTDGVLILHHWHELPPPVIIVAPPRSFTSVVCAMLGQHPQMYGFPETHLFCEDTLDRWLVRADRATYPMGHGLIRAVAQLYFGGQDEATVALAQRWLRARRGVTTEFIFKALADRVFPAIPVDKSPSTVNNLKTLQGVRRKLPAAKFLHLLRHPRGHGESVMRFMAEREKRGPIPAKHWLMEISRHGGDGAPLDPQHGWYARNTMIREFLRSVPAPDRLAVRGEDLLAEPDRVLPAIAEWLGLRTDARAIDAMKHPERSPFAFLGPPGARYGNDAFFLSAPALRAARARPHRLDGPLAWLPDGRGFTPDVTALAREFGYT